MPVKKYKYSKAKILILLVASAILFNAKAAVAANIMETESYSFTIISMADADDKAPYVTDIFPANGSVGMGINTKPSCHVKDDLTGVDINSIVMKVNGNIIPINVIGDKNDFFVEGDPGILPWNETIHTTIDACDLANN